MSEPWLVAGLGNPGDRYARTRHNAGAMVVEELARRFEAKLKKVRTISVMAAECREESWRTSRRTRNNPKVTARRKQSSSGPSAITPMPHSCSD